MFVQVRPSTAHSGYRCAAINRVAPRAASESGQALRAVVGDLHAGDLFERTVRSRGVAHQFRGIPVDLVEVGSIGRDPVIARSATDISTQRPEGSIARDLRTRGIFRDLQPATIDSVAAEIAVPEVRRVYESIVRGDTQPAQFG